jgi:hypothetical protein
MVATMVEHYDDDDVDAEVDLSGLPMNKLEGTKLNWSCVTPETRNLKVADMITCHESTLKTPGIVPSCR